MLRQFIRSYSTASSGAASSIAALKARAPWKKLDYVSPTQSQMLKTSISHLFQVPEKQYVPGDAVPPGFHMAYFNPCDPEPTLASDGYSEQQAPGEPFVNRMWLGGSVEFHKGRQLSMGQQSTCDESLIQVREPGSSSSGDKLLVTIQRDLRNDSQPAEEPAVTEKRTLIYMKAETGQKRGATFDKIISPPEGATHSVSFVPSSTLLFRYSALTFNGHKIHYDPDYAREVESLPAVIVHGPLTVTLMLTWMNGLIEKELPGKRISNFEYKNVLPLFCDQKLTLRAKPLKNSDGYKVWIENHNGSLCMNGTVQVE
ncbi:Mesaconyl-C(4)-CoA hydratase [Yarrowia sp. C11]|nr:Mesaconyl-C(4)-CoA hydratase [Yarrowia sp. E02]KAG5369862.1 Mesaconyl-C(4)-CoA hydratase [Yarrowia sp. C11]